MIFENRTSAGELLASKLAGFSSQNCLVLAIPRGGVVVGYEITQRLNCSLEVIITKKISAPGNPELAIGAVGSFGEPVINEEMVKNTGATSDYLSKQIVDVRKLIKGKESIFRKGKPPLVMTGKIVILVDDGIATGATMTAAIEILRQENPDRIVVAVPVIAKDALSSIEEKADEVVYLEAPELFFSLSQFYKEFPQVLDQEVIELLR